MKKLLIIVTTAVAFASYSYAQGTIELSNRENTGLSSAATANGLVWTNDGRGGIGLWDGTQYNLSLEILGGPSTAALTPLKLIREDLVAAAGDYTGWDRPGYFSGTWNEIAVLTVPGITPGGTAWIHLKLWWSAGGPVYPTYEAAKASGTSFFGEAFFEQPTGNPVKIPPDLPVSLIGMPAIVMLIPEPGVFAFAGLGLASLLIFRRRK